MLFILVIDVLSSLFDKAGRMGLLHALDNSNVKNRVSIYVDDVVMFIKPAEEDLSCTMVILDGFGEASGLIANMQKNYVIPIRCNVVALQAIFNSLQCTIGSFLCKYLGLPISNLKLRKSDILEWVEKIADRLPSWKASLLNLAGRTTLVKSVLSAIPVHLLIALNVPRWVVKTIDKI